MRIAFLAAEGAPWSRTGGLGEVAGALSAALHAPDDPVAPTEVGLCLPLHRETWKAAALLGQKIEPIGLKAEAWLGGQRTEFKIFRVAGERRPVWLFDAPELFDRDGIYNDREYRSYTDNATRFAAFTKAAVASLPELMGGPVDVLHAHDWQCGLVPAFLRMRRGDPRFEQTRTVMTVHNLAHQGVFDSRMMDSLGLPWEWYHVDGLEFHDRISFMKAGLTMSDVVTTVSPNYAAEIRTSAQGFGLEGVLRALGGRLVGLLNGIDGEAWDPRHDRALPAPYDVDDLTGKAVCRDALLAELGLDPADAQTPVLGFVGRLAWQKGVDLIAELGDDIVQANCRLVLLGNGEPGLERQLRALASRYPTRVAARIGFDLDLSHRVEAGSDIFLMPSRFEPCGLNQMYSMAYGTVPVVHATGGLRDTVIDATTAALADGTATGFCCEHADVGGLRWALRRAIEMFRGDPESWRALQRNGMSRDWTWQAAARPYRELYGKLCGEG